MKFLSEKTVLKFLGLPKIESSIVISDPFQKDCPMVFISKEFSVRFYKRRVYGNGVKNCGSNKKFNFKNITNKKHLLTTSKLKHAYEWSTIRICFTQFQR